MADIKEYEKLSMIERLNYFRNLHHADGSDTEAGIIAEAINAVLPHLDKLAHLKVMPYALDWKGAFREDQAAVFDDRMVSEKEVLDAVNAGEVYNDQIIFMSEKQYDNIFKVNPTTAVKKAKAPGKKKQSKPASK